MRSTVPALAATAFLSFPLQAGAQPSSNAPWQVDTLRHDDGRLDFLTAYLGARETSRAPDAGIEMGFLILCDGASSGIFISAGTPLADQSRIAFRFDNEVAETASWAVDPRDGVSVMLREANAVRSLVERVLTADEMMVRFEDADWIEAVFDLRMEEEMRRKSIPQARAEGRLDTPLGEIDVCEVAAARGGPNRAGETKENSGLEGRPESVYRASAERTQRENSTR